MKVVFMSYYFLSLSLLISGPVNHLFFFPLSHQKYRQIRNLLKISARVTVLEALAYTFSFANIRVSLQIKALFAL